MSLVTYADGARTTPEELVEFYRRVEHTIAAQPEQVRRMVANSVAFVTAWADGQLIGLARGVCDGLRGYLTECKLERRFQGPAAVTHTDGRIEHDTAGIAREMARRVLEKLYAAGVQRVDVVAWGTEVDFLEELGFRRSAGLVGMTLRAEHWPAFARPAPSPTDG